MNTYNKRIFEANKNEAKYKWGKKMYTQTSLQQGQCLPST